MTTRHKHEFKPLLLPGLHDLDEIGLRAMVVGRFPRSMRRDSLWKNFLAIVHRLKTLNLPCKIWIDGSFLTEKIDPDDIDFIVDFPIHIIENATTAQIHLIQQLANRNFHDNEKLHTFVMVTAPINHKEYPAHAAVHEQWKIDFGFSYNNREPKGIAVLEVRP